MAARFTCLPFLLFTYAAMVAQPSVDIELYANGFDKMAELACAGDGRLFLVEQTGKIKVIEPGGMVRPVPFLDISTKLHPEATVLFSEKGLLGMAFSPNYATDGNFYVSYNDTMGHGNSVVARYHVSADPNVADAGSEEQLLHIYQPYDNHKGGCLKFGQDGYLYCGFGDGGGGGDPQNRAQNLDSLQGKLLRIDVSNAGPYTIPTSNPFVANSNARPEIWAYGLRNPWRFSFDRVSGDLWIADVGQQNWEELNFQPLNSVGGENYGWRCFEGNHPYDTTGCASISSYVPPVLEYAQNITGGCSIIGGYVYRGALSANMYGRYFFTDYCNDIIYGLIPVSYVPFIAGSFPDKSFVSFGEDSAGELYVASQADGAVYKLVEKPNQIIEAATDVTALQLFPVPNSGSFSCRLQMKEACRLFADVVSVNGRVLFSSEFDVTAGANQIDFTLKTTPGIYLLKLSTSRGVITKRFVVL